MIKFFLFLALALSPGLASASSTRIVPADSFISSDATKSYPLPTTADTLAGKSVPNGGTGATSFSAGGVCLGAGTSPLTSLLGTTTGDVLTWSGTAWTSAAAGGGSSSAVTKSITQTSHGFSVGNWVYYNGTAYALSKADADATSDVVGVVSAVANSNTFTLLTAGYVTGLSGLTAGSAHYLSDATAGAITSTAPTTVTHVNKPVLLADSTSSGYVQVSRGYVIAASAGSGMQPLGHVEITCTNEAGITASTAGSTFGACTSGYTCTAFGSVSCPSSNRYGVRLTSPKAGTYQFDWNNIALYNGNGSTRSYIGMTDGTTGFAKGVYYSANALGFTFKGGSINYTTAQSTTDFLLMGGSGSGSLTADNSSSPSFVNPVQIFVYYSP